MQFKTRLIIAFVTMITMPVLLAVVVIMLMGRYQLSSMEKTYDISGTTVENFSNPIKVMAKFIEKPYDELRETAKSRPECLEDVAYLERFNEKLEKKNAYLLVTKEEKPIYVGTDMERAERVLERLPSEGEIKIDSEDGIYLGGKVQALVKNVDFFCKDHFKGSAFIVTDVSKMIPEFKELAVDIIGVILLALVLSAAALMLWIYRSVVQPLGKMKSAAQSIRDGNLDFELKKTTNDELGQLCQDLEDMRRRLKENAEEKLKFDRESRELISNISHDLKTPVTAIKGYAEGLIDRVADTPEKMGKYIRTIYNKASEMDTLINELTFYSKIDTNRIPYNFKTLSVSDYFNDCAEDLTLELEARGVEFGYFNYVEEGVRIIADAEQIKRVIHNIVNNSLKYMDKAKEKINLRVNDVGDFVQVELEDNGRGIAAKDLKNIFNRFYRTDVSRNSSKGGSGIGLSIAKKIVEEHGGTIWAESKEGTGMSMYFVLRKYQEAPIHE